MEQAAFYQSESAFESQFRSLYAPLCRYAATFTHDADEAEDVVQNVFIKTWQQRDALMVHTSPKSYLYKAVYHACINRVRHLNTKGTYMEQNLKQLQESSDHAHHLAEAKELEQRIAEAIDTLPEQCGKTFKLSRFHSLTYNEIAEVMGISVKTVENHMGKALGLMRLKLAEFLTFLIIWLINK